MIAMTFSPEDWRDGVKQVGSDVRLLVSAVVVASVSKIGAGVVVFPVLAFFALVGVITDIVEGKG